MLFEQMDTKNCRIVVICTSIKVVSLSKIASSKLQSGSLFDSKNLSESLFLHL